MKYFLFLLLIFHSNYMEIHYRRFKKQAPGAAFSFICMIFFILQKILSHFEHNHYCACACGTKRLSACLFPSGKRKRSTRERFCDERKSYSILRVLRLLVTRPLSDKTIVTLSAIGPQTAVVSQPRLPYMTALDYLTCFSCGTVDHSHSFSSETTTTNLNDQNKIHSTMRASISRRNEHLDSPTPRRGS